MILRQHEAARFSPEMAPDTGWQRGDNWLPIGRQPAFAPGAHDMRAQHQILNDKALVAFEPRTRRHIRLAGQLFVDDAPGGLVAATATRRPGHRWLARLVQSFPGWPLGREGGLMSGGPFCPFSRAVSSRCSPTVSVSAATSPRSWTTSAFSPENENESISTGAIPRMNHKSSLLGIASAKALPGVLPLLFPSSCPEPSASSRR